jgi:hypothetical protein
MNGVGLRRATLVWLILLAATLVTAAIGWVDVGHPGGRTAGACAAVVIAAAKCRAVAGEFMELRAAPHVLRWAFDAWLVVVTLTLVGLCIAGS